MGRPELCLSVQPFLSPRKNHLALGIRARLFFILGRLVTATHDRGTNNRPPINSIPSSARRVLSCCRVRALALTLSSSSSCWRSIWSSSLICWRTLCTTRLFMLIPVMARRFILASLVRGLPPYQGACGWGTHGTPLVHGGPRNSRGQTKVDRKPLPHLAGVSRRRLPLPLERGLAPQPLEKVGRVYGCPCTLLRGARGQRAFWSMDRPDPSHCRRERGTEVPRTVGFSARALTTVISHRGEGSLDPRFTAAGKKWWSTGEGAPVCPLEVATFPYGVGGRF